MKFREHRGSLAEALETLVEIEPTAAAVCEHLNKAHGQSNKRFFLKPSNITCELYLDEPDNRSGVEWTKTYVISDELGVIGFCNQLLDED